MSTSVGAVSFDMMLNANPFNKGLKQAGNNIKSSGIENSIKNIGKTVVAAFSVGAVVNFTKECLELGSNLTEVQNVVDVTFGNLNTQVDEFAKNAIDQFGLGQTVTKKYVGTFGAMAKAFDFNNQAALEMSETLTGLVGDVASFYNLSSDEAFTKLKSVFTGETETLKDLGIVMTQTALDQYALQNGFGKTTSKMTEQEKTALRYQFVLDKLSLAQGDFARTSDSWANQTRVLSLRFDELKGTLGQGFINLFTPIVKGINWVLSKLQVLADAFKSFTESITGNKVDSGGLGSTAGDIAEITDSASNASDAVADIGTSAQKTQKDLLGLRGIDEINNLSTSNSDSGGSGTNIGNNTIDFGNSLSDANKEMDGLLNKANEFFSTFTDGFREGFGDFDFSNLLNEIDGIKNSLINIFTAPEVVNAASNWASTILYNFGRITGSVANVGLTIADNLIGGINVFLNQNQQDIQEHIVRLFDISSRTAEITGNFATTFADIFHTVFSSDVAKQITGNLLAIFTDSFLGIQEVGMQFGNDLIYIITEPINENKDLISQTLLGIFEPLSSILGTIKQGIQDTFSKFWEVYDTYIAPAVENIKNGFSDILKTVLTVWNENIKPILDEWAEKFDTLWTEHIQPMVDKFLEFIGKLISGISEIWNTWLVPLINWIVENVVPVLSPIFETIGNLFMTAFGIISDVLGGIWDALGGLIDFIVGVFTGDWEKAWNGIKEIFSGIWDAIKGVFEGIWNAIKDVVSGAINTIKNLISSVMNAISSLWSNIWNGIKNTASNIWNGITSTISNVINGIKNTISNVLNTLSSIWSNIWNGMKNTVTNIFNGIWNSIKGVINSILGGIEGMANGVINGVNTIIRALNNLHFDIPDWVPIFGGKRFGFNIPQLNRVSLPRLAEGGYVKANTPQLAMIGDNRHQGEIVAPEGKISSIVADELEKFNKGTGNNSEIVSLLKEILKYLRTSESNLTLNVDDIQLAKAVLRGLRKLQSKTDKPIFDFI
ncbi:MAG: hypothetical protein ACLUWN_02490 [Clostridia bacterium]|jgi:phage-related protein